MKCMMFNRQKLSLSCNDFGAGCTAAARMACSDRLLILFLKLGVINRYTKTVYQIGILVRWGYIYYVGVLTY